MAIYAQRYAASGAESRRRVQGQCLHHGPAGLLQHRDEPLRRISSSPGAAGDRTATEGIFGQRYDAAGNPVGGEFQANTYTTGTQDSAGRRRWPRTAASSWSGRATAGGPESAEARGRRYDASGNAQGGEFAVNTYTTGRQYAYAIGMDARGNFVVTWNDDARDGSATRRRPAASAPMGRRAATSSWSTPTPRTRRACSRMSSDAVGNFVVAWSSFGAGRDPATALLLSASAGSCRPRWRWTPRRTACWSRAKRSTSAPPGATSTAPRRPSRRGCPASRGRRAPRTPSPTATGDYGTVADGATAPCIGCYGVSVSDPASRPATHWDASGVESITPDAQGQQKQWLLHVGDSFTDVPTASAFYRFVETLLHHGVTGGCAATAVLPGRLDDARADGRVRAGGEGRNGVRSARLHARRCSPTCPRPIPSAGGSRSWPDAASSAAAVAGTTARTTAVTREQMAVFVLRTLDPALVPPACTAPLFNDVPADSAVLPLDRGAGTARRGHRLRRRQLLPGRRRDPRADGRVHQRDVRPHAVRPLIRGRPRPPTRRCLRGTRRGASALPPRTPSAAP